jgi:hypothetical protein
MTRFALFAAVALTVMVVPMTAPATPTPDPSDCPYLRITAEERPAPSPVVDPPEPPKVKVDAFAVCGAKARARLVRAARDLYRHRRRGGAVSHRGHRHRRRWGDGATGLDSARYRHRLLSHQSSPYPHRLEQPYVWQMPLHSHGP